MDGRQQKGLDQHVVARRDELREEREVEQRDFWVQHVREPALSEGAARRACPPCRSHRSARRPKRVADGPDPEISEISAPANFTTVNASALVARMSESPSAEAVACTGRPAQMPRLVKNAARLPSSSVTFATSAMSAPGRIVSSAAIPMKARIEPSRVTPLWPGRPCA